MKILTIVGARPQFIKASVVSSVFADKDYWKREIAEVVVHTGQHFDENMSDVFFQELGMKQPAYNLGITHPTHGGMTGRMLEKIDEIISSESPDWVLVYGDTNSTLAGALAAAKLHVPVAHIEAGLRSFNREMPEEINRVLTDHCSDMLFAPTQLAVDNLHAEGVSEGKVKFVGDVMYDVALFYGTKAEKNSVIIAELGLQKGSYILSTIHRAENTDNRDRLYTIMQALKKLSEKILIILPLHPRTRAALQKFDMLDEMGNYLELIEPVGYLDMVMLEKYASVIATDSGGVQKEAFFYGIPCVTLRDETEWKELVELGWNKVVSPIDIESIVMAFTEPFQKNLNQANPYGDGASSRKITSFLLS